MWQGGLLSFIRHFWHVLEPATEFVDGWAIEAVCQHLEAVTFGEITRLLMNVPPGFCKPVADDELVMTGRGRVALRDIVVGDSVLTHQGRYRAVTAIHEQGALPVVRIETMGGRVVRMAPDHPCLTARGWIAAGDLTQNDVLAAVVSQDPTGTAMDPREARFLGYLIGDGSVKYAAASFTNADPDVLDDFERCANYLGIDVRRRVKPGCRATLMMLSAERSPRVREILERHGIKGKDSYTKRIPLSVMNADLTAIGHFMGAYWTCDGGVGIRHDGNKTSHQATLVTVSEGLARDSQHLMLRLGISTRVRTNVRNIKTKRQGARYVSYIVQATTEHQVSKIAKLPGLCPTKVAAIASAIPREFETHLRADRVVSVALDGEASCRCLTVDEDCSFTAGDLAVHNSLITDVFWPAWEWGPMGMAHVRYVAFSYSARLTERDNGRFSDLIQSNEYQALYGESVVARKTGDKKVSNTAKGWKLASSVGGVGTGERGDRIICDDPHNVKEGESDIVRKGTVQWFREAMSNRLNSPATGAIIIIMQRVHEEDVSGTVLSLDLPYCHLMIPMEYDPARQVGENGEPVATDIGWIDPRFDIDDIEGSIDALAWPERFPESVVKSTKKEVGPFAWASQYQQTPEARGGGLFQRSWWQLWDPPDGKFPALEYVVASLDSAFTKKEENDPSGFTIWGVFLNETGHRRIILLHAWRKWLKMHGPKVDRLPRESDLAYRRRASPHWGLVEWTADSCKRFKVDRLLIEAKASGITAGQELERLHGREGWAIQLEPVKGDKVARAMAVQPTFSQEMVYAPVRDWSEMVIDEMAVFPKGKLKDLTDSATQAIKHLRDSGLAQSDEEEQHDTNEALRLKKPKKALYPA